MLPFVMLPRPLQESGVVGKGGTAGFLGKAYDPYTLYPPGGDMDMQKMAKFRVWMTWRCAQICLGCGLRDRRDCVIRLMKLCQL